MVDNFNKKRAIEIFMIDDEYKFYHAGFCKVLIDLCNKALVIKNYDIDILKFVATFDWHFVQKHNILLAFAPHSCNKFILIFKDASICNQMYSIITKNEVNHLDDPETLLEQRFLIPVLETIQSHRDRAPFLQQLLTNFVEVLELPEKKMYLSFLRANNFFYDVYPQAERDIEIPGESIESSVDGVKEEVSTFEEAKYGWPRGGSPTSELVMNVVEAVSGHSEVYDVEEQDEVMEDSNAGLSTSDLPYFIDGPTTSHWNSRRSRQPTSQSLGNRSTTATATKKKSYAGSIDNILSGRKTQIKRYKSYLEKLSGLNLTAEERRKREEYLKCLAVVRITLIKARLQRDLNTFIKRSFGNEMRERLDRSNFTFEMVQEILKKENPRAHKQLWMAFNETLKNNKGFWDRVIGSKDEWNKAFNPDIKLNTYLYEQETYQDS
uniref:Uncharacterized protein n=1 Tax=Panagrolaimus superbus TaxID=310955 RepID=A0A914Z7X0_9BILA